MSLVFVLFQTGPSEGLGARPTGTDRGHGFSLRFFTSNALKGVGSN
jgi:hypothetical protein